MLATFDYWIAKQVDNASKHPTPILYTILTNKPTKYQCYPIVAKIEVWRKRKTHKSLFYNNL